MYDSIDLSQIPLDAQMVAGYVDGHWPTAQFISKRFPHARVVTITVLGTTTAAVVDIETGDCTPASGVAAIRRGVAHTPYCNLSTLAAVLHQIDSQGLSRSTPIWTAHYTGRPHLCGSACFAGLGLRWTPHVVATQFTDRSHGRNLDESVVADLWPGVDPEPTPPKPHVNPTPAPTPVTEGEDVKVIRAKGTLPQYVSNGITRRWITSPAEKAELVAAGLIDDTVHDLDAAVVNAIALVGPTPR